MTVDLRADPSQIRMFFSGPQRSSDGLDHPRTEPESFGQAKHPRA
jgi:hypothetical protein